MSELAERGARRIEWARDHMPVLSANRDELTQKKNLRGLRIGMALHVEAKTGVLALSLKEAGAQIRLASCNPLSTDDSVAAALAEVHGLDVYAKKWQTNEEYYANLNKVLDLKPDLVIDDGADLVFLLHTKRTDLLKGVRGGNEETTTGVIRLRAMERDGALRFPIIDVNDAQMKHFFDNRYGTGQSTIDGLMTATNLLIAGRTFVDAGYGWTGRGIAMRARGMGARVVVTEVDPVKAIEATMDGFEVLPMSKASRIADFIISATGGKDVLTAAHFPRLKDRVVLGNAGHFDNEISKADLDRLSKTKKKVREFVDEFAPASWWDIEGLHRARKIGTRESMAREFALLHAKQADLIRFVDDHVEMDDTFRDFAAFCQRRQIPLEIVSEGLDFYVRHLMRRWELRLPLRANHAVFEEGSVRIEYPWADATCTLCGTCKLLRLFQLRTEGYRIAYVGDGHSDLCPALEADHVFAKAELAQLCDQEEIAYISFDRFADVQRNLVGLT